MEKMNQGTTTQVLYPEYVGLSAVALAQIQKTLAAGLETLKAEATDVQKRYDYVRQASLPTAMENEGLEKFTADGIGTVYLASDMWVKVMPGKSDALQQWLSNNGHADLIKPTVNASSLKAAITQMMAKGEMVPESLVKVTPYTRACILSK
jgi:hypothetical protein